MGSIPIERVLELKQRYHLKAAVETGTFRGQGAALLAERFERVITIEGNRARFERTAAHYAGQFPNLSFRYGDSRHLLARALAELDQPCLLWLDAHMCNETYDPAEVGGECPILSELAAVTASAHAANHVILIDDARYFTGRPKYPHDPAQWPTYADIERTLAPRVLTIEDDVIYAEPAT